MTARLPRAALLVLVVGLALHNLAMALLWQAGVRNTALDVAAAWKEIVLVVDEDRAARLEVADDVEVVDDLLPDVDRRAVVLERALDGLHGPVDARAVAARRRQ